MRRIKIHKWKENNSKGEQLEADTLVMLTVLVNMKKQEDMPRGLDQFRLFHRISQAFENAKQKGTLCLEEADYSFLKKSVEQDIPANWGSNPDVMKAVDDFINAQSED